jgi:hypothetical protein
VNKVDLLFDIDNSSSMADKQEYLAKAIPDLVARLVTPIRIGSSSCARATEDDARAAVSAGPI